ncbi:MAG: hypothetical protein QOF28_764, partial [Actinomycetota bacterium]|nr:hypothetical protein [Actinomycetota bacterium]
MAAEPPTTTGKPISAAMLARSHGVGEPRFSPGGRWMSWLDSWDGRTDVVVAPVAGDRPPRVVTADFAVTPAGAYGGGAYCWITDETLAVAGADGALAVVSSAGGVVRVLSADGRAGAPAAAPDGSAIAFSVERADACDIAVVPVDGSAWPQRQSNADFAWDPAWSVDGAALAWHEWDLDEMSWDASRIALRRLADNEAKVVAGGAGEGVGQPRFSPDGAHLAWVSDRSGVTNLWVASSDGSQAKPFTAEADECAAPAWGPGQRTYAWSPDGREIAWCRNEQGF